MFYCNYVSYESEFCLKNTTMILIQDMFENEKAEFVLNGQGF